MFLIPEVGTIIWMSIIFMIVVFIMGKFAWKPLLKSLSDRERNIDTALKSADDARALLHNLELEKDKIQNMTRLERDKLIQEGIELRDKIVSEAKEKARIEAEKVILEAQLIIRKEREASIFEIRNQVGQLSLEIAAKLIKLDMEDTKRHQKLVSELVNEIELN